MRRAALLLVALLTNAQTAWADFDGTYIDENGDEQYLNNEDFDACPIVNTGDGDFYLDPEISWYYVEGNVTIATGIASVTAIAGRWDGDNNEPKPIGEGSDYKSLGTVTFGGVTVDWDELTEAGYYYGALTLSFTEEDINRWDPDWDQGMTEEWRDIWTLTPKKDENE